MEVVRKLTETFVRDRRSFWRDVEKARSETKKRAQTIKDKNGQVIAEDVEASQELLNFEEEREAIALAIKGGGKCLC